MDITVVVFVRFLHNRNVKSGKRIKNKKSNKYYGYFEDFLKIQKQIKALGSFGGILSMLPLGISKDDTDKISHEGEKQFKKLLPLSLTI